MENLAVIFCFIACTTGQQNGHDAMTVNEQNHDSFNTRPNFHGRHFTYPGNMVRLPRQPTNTIDKQLQHIKPNNTHPINHASDNRYFPYHNTEANGRPIPSYYSPHTSLKPVDQHFLMRPPPVFDADVHFDEAVHYNAYRPMSEYGGIHRVIADQHDPSRPPVTGIQNSLMPNRDNYNTAVNHGHGFIDYYQRPLNTNLANKPNIDMNSEHMMQTRLPIGPTFPLPPVMHGYTMNAPPVMVDGTPWAGYHQAPGAPRKPGFVILAQNVFINPQKQFNAASTSGPINPLSLIRFDHGRDHHVRPDPITIENNIEFVEMSKPPFFNNEFMSAAKLDALSKPKVQWPEKGNGDILQKPSYSNKPSANNKPGYNTKPSDNNKPNAGDKDRFEQLENVYQNLLQSAKTPPIEGTKTQFHPLLSPMM